MQSVKVAGPLSCEASEGFDPDLARARELMGGPA